MKFLVLLTLCCLIIYVDCSNDRDLAYMSKLIRYFAARVGYMILRDDPTPSFVFSGLRVVDTLMTMHSAGSAKTTQVITLWLGLTQSLEYNGCAIMDELTTYPKENSHEKSLNVSFDKKLFYQDGLILEKKALKSECFKEKEQMIDFRNEHAAQDIINQYYDVSKRLFYSKYLKEPLPQQTNVFLMNRVFIKPFEVTSLFGSHSEIQFINLNRQIVKVPAMEIIGKIYHLFSPSYLAYLFRYDIPGDVYSYVIIQPFFRTDNYKNEMYFYLTAQKYEAILMEAMGIEKPNNFKVVLPILQMVTHADLKSYFMEMGMDFFSEKKPLPELSLQNDTTQYNFLHSEFIEMIGNPDVPEDKDTPAFQIVYPFIFTVMDRRYNIPIQTAVFTGINPEPKKMNPLIID